MFLWFATSVHVATFLYPRDLVTSPGRSAHHSFGVVGGLVVGNVHTGVAMLPDVVVVVVVVTHSLLVYQKSCLGSSVRSAVPWAELENSLHLNSDVL